MNPEKEIRIFGPEMIAKLNPRKANQVRGKTHKGKEAENSQPKNDALTTTKSNQKGKESEKAIT